MSSTGHRRRAGHKRHRTAYFRSRLLERYHKLMGGSWREEGLFGRRTGSGPLDAEDMARDCSDEEVAFRVAEVRSDEIAEIEEALRRIAEGTYGVCDECGRRIRVARLEAMPSASLCVACQQKLERERGVASEKTSWTRLGDQGYAEGYGHSRGRVCKRT